MSITVDCQKVTIDTEYIRLLQNNSTLTYNCIEMTIKAFQKPTQVLNLHKVMSEGMYT